mmetsp:Transcript_6517/g.10351  ORF Transcript_6517/g.10351 Transcript_6517/m.10351 type:complete len:241 (-) Transcript_6517:141-863(-)
MAWFIILNTIRFITPFFLSCSARSPCSTCKWSAHRAKILDIKLPVIRMTMRVIKALFFISSLVCQCHASRHIPDDMFSHLATALLALAAIIRSSTTLSHQRSNAPDVFRRFQCDSTRAQMPLPLRCLHAFSHQVSKAAYTPSRCILARIRRIRARCALSSSMLPCHLSSIITILLFVVWKRVRCISALFRISSTVCRCHASRHIAEDWFIHLAITVLILAVIVLSSATVFRHLSTAADKL